MNKRWPAAIVVALGARYAMDSLRHRRERGQGYSLHGDEIDVGSEAFLAATEAITSAPIAVGNSIELFINGDEIFPGDARDDRERPALCEPRDLRVLAQRDRPDGRRRPVRAGARRRCRERAARCDRLLVDRV